MKLNATLLSLAIVATATVSHAQGTLLGTNAINDQIDDVTTEIERDFKRSQDDARFGNPDQKQGLSGSFSIGYSGQSGNQDTQDLLLAGRIRHASGRLVQTVGVTLDFSEANGTKTSHEVFGVYDANYYLTDRFYGFALARLNMDDLAAGSNFRRDHFIGFGPGYRIVNTPDLTWRVQAGVGVNYTKTGAGLSTTDTGYIASSRLYFKFSDAVFASNDTDILKTDQALRVNNELGLNFKVTDVISTRISYMTDYNDARAIKTDNKVGVSVVFGF
jgi:putative salt-induced outer membrane protein